MEATTIGDRITGRCVATSEIFSGTVIAVYRPRTADSEIRYRLCDTGQYWSFGSSVEPVVYLLATNQGC